MNGEEHGAQQESEGKEARLVLVADKRVGGDTAEQDELRELRRP